MLRMYLPSADVRAAADIILKILDNVLEHDSDSKYWRINVHNEVRSFKMFLDV
jgi:hypothetical protein